MVTPRLHMVPDGVLARPLEDLRIRHSVEVGWPPEVEAAAEARSLAGPIEVDRVDRTDLDLSTLDPAGSRDLDQAFRLAQDDDGYILRYAIADLAAWIEPGDALDREAHRRGATLYLPDGRVPLHPPTLSEGAASLLPGQRTPAVLWTIRIDASGTVGLDRVERAWVASRGQRTYDDTQRELDSGRADPQVLLLAAVGALLRNAEAARGGISLDAGEQSVERTAAGYSLEFRVPSRIEQDNAQLSLACGRVAATLMVDAGVGLLRTMPSPDPLTVDRLRRSSLALDVAWPPDRSYGDWLRSLERDDPAAMALRVQAARTLRGASYTPITPRSVPAELIHGAIASPYAHVTAPLRRLADRYATECCLAVFAGAAPPDWVTTALLSLPETMTAASRRDSAVERDVVDLMEAAVLEARVGEQFEATVIDTDGRRRTLQLADPPVVWRGTIDGALGAIVQLVLSTASLDPPSLHFSNVRDP